MSGTARMTCRRVGAYLLALSLSTLAVHASSPPTGIVGIEFADPGPAGYAGISWVAPLGPAEDAGIKGGDRLFAVNGRPVKDESRRDITRALDGSPGSTVTLTVQSFGELLQDIPLVRRPAYDVYLAAANVGDAEAEWALGSILAHGAGCPQDLAQAAKWYRKSAEQGFQFAETELGYCLQYGRGVPKDPAEAVAWYQKAAQQGDPTAERLLGLCYLHGTGIARSDRDAFAWIDAAAKADDASAEEHLGYLYTTGRGVARDDRASFAWYYRSAQLGYAYGEWALADAYEAGRGVTASDTESLKWYLKAQAQLPDNPALQKLVALKTLIVFLKDPKGATHFDPGALLQVFRPQLLAVFALLATLYLIGAALLLWASFRATDPLGNPGLAGGWIIFFFEGQLVAFLGLCLLAQTVNASLLMLATALICTLPLILSTAGRAGRHAWQPSTASRATVLRYGLAAALAIILADAGFNAAYQAVARGPAPRPADDGVDRQGEGFLALGHLPGRGGAAADRLGDPLSRLSFRRRAALAARRRGGGGGARWCSPSPISRASTPSRSLAWALVFGWARLKTNSLRLPAALHILNNGISLALGG